MSIYVYGDSNSAEWITGPSWVARFGTRLVGETRGPSKVVNRAIGGQRMHYPRGQSEVPGVSWPAVEKYAIDDLGGANPRPTKVILCIGTNDIPVEYTPDSDWNDLVASFDVLDEALRERWGITLYVMPTIPMRVQGMVSRATYDQRYPRLVALNQSLKTRFQSTGRYLTASQAVAQANGEMKAEASHGDGLHINKWGHVMIADALPMSPFINA